MPGMSVRHKKTVSVTLEPALLQQARDAGINLSAVLTAALKRKSVPQALNAGKQKIERVCRSSIVLLMSTAFYRTITGRFNHAIHGLSQ